MAGSWKDFKENPVKFCRERFVRALEHSQQFRDINRENLGMYEGRDPMLESRRSNKDVVRSSLFMQILAPAIDTNVADAVAVVNSMVSPISVRPRWTQEQFDEYSGMQGGPLAQITGWQEIVDKAAWVEREVNTKLRECGYFPFGFEEHVRGAEIYRTPSVVKVGWRQSRRVLPEVSDAYAQGDPLQRLLASAAPVNWTEYDDGEFYVQYLPPDEFLYEPLLSVQDFDQSCFTAHVVWRTEDELLSQAYHMGYDTRKIRDYFSGKKKQSTGSGVDAANPTLNHKEEALQDRGDGGYWQQLDPSNRAMVAECYIYLVDGEGQGRKQFVTLLGGDTILNRDNNFEPPYKGFCHPFVPLVGNPMPGTMEGLSSVDLGRGHQRAFNDVFNIQADAISFSIFGPMKMSATNSFLEKPVYGLGAVWRLRVAEDLQPVSEIRNIPELTYLMKVTDDNLQRAINTPDNRQGEPGNPYQKATQAKLQAAGANRRAIPKNARFGMAASRVASACIALHQQFAQNKEKWIIPGGYIVDTPGFTYGYDSEVKKQDLLLALSTVAQLPLYQSGTGTDKIRQLVADLLKVVAPDNHGAYTITKEEMLSDIQAMAAAQAASLPLETQAPSGKETSNV